MKVVNVKNVAIGEGMTKICVPLVAPTDYDVDYQLRIIAKSEPDMVEFRADMYEKCFDREALMKTLAKIHDKLGQFPIIFTFRTKGEGGCMEATLSQYHDLLIDAMEQIVDRFKSIIFTGADIAKIAMMPEEGSQVVDMMQAAKELQDSGNQTPLIVISMGELGVETRTTGEMYGNTISFATAGIPSAPGQISVDALRSQLTMIHHIIAGK